MRDRLVSIDVEPGGTSRPVGYVGLAEVVDGRPGTSWCGRFWSPFAGQEWAAWAFARAADSYEWWAGRTSDAWSAPEEPTTLVDELVEDWGEDQHPPRREPEWAKPEPPTFAELWGSVVRFVGDAATAAFGASYDARQVARLCDASGIDAPRWWMLDGRQLLQPLGYRGRVDEWSEAIVDTFTAGGDTLEAVQVRLGLRSDVEAAWRGTQHVRWGIGNKHLLHDAEDDAIANAALFVAALARARTASVEDLATVHGLTTYSTRRGDSDG